LTEEAGLTRVEPQFGMALKFDPASSTTLLSISGELDLAVTGRVHDALEQIERSAGKRLEIDLSELSFIDVTGVRAILSAYKRAVERGSPELSIRPGPGAVQRVFSLLGLADELPFLKP
jgi:anti-anti-sigma factor